MNSRRLIVELPVEDKAYQRTNECDELPPPHGLSPRPGSQKTITGLEWVGGVHRNKKTRPMSALGLGCAKTFRHRPRPYSDRSDALQHCHVSVILRLRHRIRLWSFPRRSESSAFAGKRSRGCPILQARIATRSGFTPTMFITRVRL